MDPTFVIIREDLQVDPVTIVAPTQPGEFHSTIAIQTDLVTAPQTSCLVRGTVRGDSPTAATSSRPIDSVMPR